MNNFYNPVRTIQGYNSLEDLVKHTENFENILVVTSSKSVKDSVALQKVEEKSRVQYIEFLVSNPEVSDLFDVYKQAKTENIDLIVAIGGGSVLDVSKSLCCILDKDIANEDELRNVIEAKDYQNIKRSWIGIPTTAGTGSEVTCWATIWDSENNKKYSIDSDKNYAKLAIVDPKLLEKMPIKLEISSALDAVAHALESYWAVASNEISKTFALKAIQEQQLVIRFLIQLQCTLMYHMVLLLHF